MNSSLHPPHITTFPDNVLSNVFNFINKPLAFSQTCKFLYNFANDPVNVANYRLAQYGPVMVFYHIIKSRPRHIAPEKIVTVLVNKGIQSSRYLIQEIINGMLYISCFIIFIPFIALTLIWQIRRVPDKRHPIVLIVRTKSWMQKR